MNKIMKKNQLWIAVAFMIAMQGCAKKQESSESNQSNAISVKTEVVKAFQGNSVLKYSGTVEPEQTIPLSFQNSGTVMSVLVQEGDFVRKGQVLATLDKSDNQNMYDVSLAKYQQAKDAYDRMKSVHDNGSLPEIKWVEMETNMKQAESQLELVKSNLEKCVLYSPDNGMIGSRNVEPGQSAMSAITPLELVKIDHVLIKISVPETEISRMHKGLKATIVVPALGDNIYEGVVTNVGVVANQFSRTYDVKIKVNNPNKEIKPGMVCDVSLDTKIEKELVLISKNAIDMENDGRNYVFVVTPDKKSVKKCEVVLGSYCENGIVVISGLSAGETIVAEGKEKLDDNSVISL